MDIEERIKRLEDIVSPEGEEHNLADVVTGIYSNLIQHLITTGDFLFDLVNYIENYLTNITSMIPEEILEEIQKNANNAPEPKLHLLTDPPDSA